MRRFLGRNGPGAHHLTFKVPALDTTLAELAGLGIEPPKLCGVGTLLQVIQIDEGFPSPRSPAPDGFPAALNSPLRLSWVGLTAGFLPDARSLLADVLGGTVVNGGDHWMLVSWGAEGVAGASRLPHDELTRIPVWWRRTPRRRADQCR